MAPRKTKAQLVSESSDKDVVVGGDSNRKVQFMETEEKAAPKKKSTKEVETHESSPEIADQEPEALGKRVRKQTVKFEIANFKTIAKKNPSGIASNSSSATSDNKRTVKKKKTDSDEKESAGPSSKSKSTAGRKRKLANEEEDSEETEVKSSTLENIHEEDEKEVASDKKQKRRIVNKTKSNKHESEDSESNEEREQVEASAAKPESKSKKSTTTKKVDHAESHENAPADKKIRKRATNDKKEEPKSSAANIISETSQPLQQSMEKKEENDKSEDVSAAELTPEVGDHEEEPVKVEEKVTKSRAGRGANKKLEAKDVKKVTKSKQQSKASKAEEMKKETQQEIVDKEEKEDDQKLDDGDDDDDDDEEEKEQEILPTPAPAATKGRSRKKQPSPAPAAMKPENVAEVIKKKQPNGKSRPSQGICRIISWNVNGVRACFNKEDTLPTLFDQDADIICLQEVRASEKQFDSELKDQFGDYHIYWNCEGDKKGYAGVAIFSRFKPVSVTYGMDDKEFDKEGRIVTLEFDNFYLINAYVPNAGQGLKRLDYKMDWDDAFRAFVTELDAQKPVVVCGDFNVAHKEIDLANPKANVKNAGFTPEERQDFTTLLGEGFVDSFRQLYPDEEGAYTFWSTRTAARSRNVGWRLDYFVVSERVSDKVGDNVILKDIMGSDHCPILLNFNLHPDKA